MRFIVERQDADYQVSFPNKMTFNDHIEFKQVITELKEKKPQRIIFLLENLLFMDSSALGMIILAQETFQKFSIPIILRKPKEEILKTLKYSDFDKIFQIEA